MARRTFANAWVIARFVHRTGSLRETFVAVLRLEDDAFHRLLRRALARPTAPSSAPVFHPHRREQQRVPTWPWRERRARCR